MIDVTGSITNISLDFASGKPNLTLSVNEKDKLLNAYDSLKDKDKLSITIKPYRKKRSLDANAYAWLLIGKIADTLSLLSRKGIDKEEVYFDMLKKYGQSQLISVLADVPLKEYLKYYEEIGESTLGGKLFKHYRIYKGSSQFDSREMAILINGIVDDAKALGISTETPEQIANMLSLWEQAYEKHTTR